MIDTTEATTGMLHDIERHCNNYFNARNDPADPTRDYPDAFLDLAYRIQQYYLQPHLFMNKQGEFGGKDMMTPWQQVYARELSIWKRAKFI